ncbi:UDP-Glycosyltransferase [Aspergillus alliaceus]|uniref:UDP-Glycosyltransferase n=1 Tax=Petromyces alliaceus TaxID=209559 RepID=A0A8H6E2V4_PETAA|nr:UDP-Glycosyltransferase [Aspergillus burnettii]
MADVRNLATEDGSWDPPPPYESSLPTDSGPTRSNSETPSVGFPFPAPPYRELSSTNDGRVDVRIGSRFSQNLEWLMGNHAAEATPTGEEAGPSVPPAWDLHLNIVIQVVGSRGDVQPFVALGQALQRCGHRVRLATHAKFEQFVKTADLEFYPIGGDPVELMSYMVRNPGLIPSIKSLRAGDIQRKRALMAEILDGCWRSCLEPDPHDEAPFVADAIIANPPSFAHIHCAQALGVPVHLMFTMPWTSTRAFHHPLANLKYSGNDPSLGNLISYHFVEWLTWQGLGDLINTWRKNVLGLDPVPTTEGPNLVEVLNVPFTYCWSPALIPKPNDWGSNIDVCGFFFREPPAYDPPTELDAFLHAGPPPVYIGFGSIVLEDVEKTLSILLEAIQETGVRAIISCGWSNLERREFPNVHYIGDCPHEWLFQHVAAVVHHGGAGTTACGLRNGKPTAIIPFFGDQPFWGNMIAAAGAGPEPIPYKALTAQNLADAITYCLTPQATAVAKTIADRMRQECGVRAAVDSFHAHLPRHKMPCDIIPSEPAVWHFKKGKRAVKLSKVSAWILKHQGRLQEKHLKLYKTKPFIIDIRRWDPLTAVSSASLSTLTGMADATAGIFIDPYKEYKRLRYSRSRDVSKAPSTTELATLEISQPLSDPKPNSDDPDYARQMALASATSLGIFLGRSSRGALVDLPLAAVEGMRAVPRLYGEEVRVHDPVKDWRSGAVVAWSTFTHGVYEGVTDIFVHTYRGKKEQGALGVAKGLAKGVVSMTVKTGAATVGLIAYPNQGIYRSLMSTMRKKPAKRVEEAKWAEAEWISKKDESMRIDVEELCSLYDELLSTREAAGRRRSS